MSRRTSKDRAAIEARPAAWGAAIVVLILAVQPAFGAGEQERPGASSGLGRAVSSRAVQRHVAQWYQRAVSRWGELELTPGPLEPPDMERWAADAGARGPLSLRTGDDWVLGVAIAYEPRSQRPGGEEVAEGVTVAPYVTLAYGALGVNLGLGYDGNGFEPTASAPGERFFVAGGLSYARSYRGLVLSGRVGGLWVQAEPAAAELELQPGPEDLGQVTLGADLGYALGQWEPFVAGSVQYNLGRPAFEPAPALRDGASLEMGLRYRAEGLSGAIQWDAGVDGGAFDGHRINLFIRRQFD